MNTLFPTTTLFAFLLLSLLFTPQASATPDPQALKTTQAIRLQNQSATKALLTRTNRGIINRLSHLRHKPNKFNASNTPLKPNQWNTWTTANITIGKTIATAAKTTFNLDTLNIGIDRPIDHNKILGFALGLGTDSRTTKTTDFTGTIDTTQLAFSTYGALKLNKTTTIEATLGINDNSHKTTPTDTQNSDGLFTSLAYRSKVTKNQYTFTPFIRYDLLRTKMQRTPLLPAKTANDEAIALGIDIHHTRSYKNGTLNNFLNLECKTDLSRNATHYLAKNTEKESTFTLGTNYQKHNTTLAISYEHTRSKSGTAHSDTIEGSLRWQF